MVSQVNNANWLHWIEGLMETSVPRPLAASLPPSRFYCRLSEQPDHLVPSHRFRETGKRGSSPGLFVNPDAVFTHNRELPEALAGNARWLDNFALQGDLVWVQEPGSHALDPFWLGTEWGELLAGAQPGDPAPAALSPQSLRVLATANVLTSATCASERSKDWVEATSGLAKRFERRGYAPVGNLIHPFQVAALRRYYRYLIRTGVLTLGDHQSSRRYVAHNESVARFFHHQLTSTVAAIVGEPVKPSYLYLASYQGGADLTKHTDREQCEFSITLCLDYSPEPRHETRWPIHLHTPTGRVTVFQAIGDGLLYLGCELPHSRDPLPQPDTSTSIFFHYVRQDFSGSLD
jgi:hypothetical protein